MNNNYVSVSESTRRVLTDEHLSQCLISLSKITDAVRSVIEHEKTLTDACKDNGIDTRHTRDILYKLENIYDYTPQSQGRHDTEYFLCDEEKFYTDLFGNCDDMPRDYVETVRWAVNHPNLTKREREIMNARVYDNATLQELGKRYSVTRERIRQVEAKAYRKLKRPDVRDVIKNGISMKNEIDKILDEEYKNRLKQQAEIQISKIKLPNSVIIVDPSEKIEVLNLSVRPYNCIKRKGIHTVGQLCDRTSLEIAHIPNMGIKSFNEIINKLAERGLTLRE